MMYAKSTIGTPSSSAVLGGTPGGWQGAGVGAVRWNHSFAQRRVQFAPDGRPDRDMKSSQVDNRRAADGRGRLCRPPCHPGIGRLPGRVEQATRPCSTVRRGGQRRIQQFRNPTIWPAATGAPPDVVRRRVCPPAGWRPLRRLAIVRQLSVQATANLAGAHRATFRSGGFSAVRGFPSAPTPATAATSCNSRRTRRTSRARVSWPGNLRLLRLFDSGRRGVISISRFRRARRRR